MSPQVADALGVAAFRDELGFFHVVNDASVWVRLTLWGFNYTQVTVCCSVLQRVAACCSVLQKGFFHIVNDASM